MTYFHMGNPTLSSALYRFTSEFGMDQVVPVRYYRQITGLLIKEVIPYQS